MLKKLENKCKYIEIVIIGERKIIDNHIVNAFQKDIEMHKIVSEWWETETVCKNNLVRIKSSRELFEYLTKFETFCKYYFCKKYDKSFNCYVDVQECTDFGIDDIAFYDNNDNILLCTTTHECYITISEDLIN